MQKSEEYKVRIQCGNRDHEFMAAGGENLLAAMRKNGVPVNTACGGNGRCGKCAVRLKGSANETLLSCRQKITSDLEAVLINPVENGIVSVTAERSAEKTELPVDTGIAVDLGTTTIALSLVDTGSGRIIDSTSLDNPQRIWGSDVISRIAAAAEGMRDELKDLAAEGLVQGIRQLLDRNPRSAETVKAAAIAGNTAMLHFLTGQDTKGLSSFPFDPGDISLKEYRIEELLPVTDTLPAGLPVYILPGMSAFIGADIISGLYSLDFSGKKGVNAFIDLGTNAEMAVSSRGRILAASAAAGPAFEGGNIKHGTAGIPGAISNVTIKNEKAEINTILGVLPPAGICGTGVVETVSELISSGIMDRSGLLPERYFSSGFPLFTSKDGEDIVFTQNDIREFQLAKAAIRAGFELLLERSGVNASDIDRLFLAGGFGYYLDPKKAAVTGIIPEELTGKCVSAGNTSLLGATAFLTDRKKGEEGLSTLINTTGELILSADPDFNDRYIGFMEF